MEQYLISDDALNLAFEIQEEETSEALKDKFYNLIEKIERLQSLERSYVKLLQERSKDIFKDINETLNSRTLYTFDTKDWILHYCIDGEPEKIKSLAERIKKDGRCNYFISNSPNLDGMTYYDSINYETREN